MTEVLTAEQMRDIERAAIDSGAVTGLELMERAGQGVVEAVLEEWPEMAKGAHRAVVLCGPGNNGGDGFVVARLLKARGWDVAVFLYGDPARLPPDAKVNFDLWQQIGAVLPWDDGAIEDRLDDWAADRPETFGHDLVIEALFGIGLNRETPDDMDRTWHGFVPAVTHTAQHRRPKYVAIDIPAGIDSDTGANLGAFPADLTVTFHRLKKGHVQGDMHGFCGKVVVKDIGL